MITVVSDDKVILAIQGIRNVTWGETTFISPTTRPWFITVTYKNGHNIFYYNTEEEAKGIFNKVRKAMEKKK